LASSFTRTAFPAPRGGERNAPAAKEQTAYRRDENRRCFDEPDDVRRTTERGWSTPNIGANQSPCTALILIRHRAKGKRRPEYSSIYARN
jgi:hypothetical protein